MKKTKKKKKLKYCEYRILKRDNNFSVIKVYLNRSNEIIGYSDYIIPTSDSVTGLKILLSSMLTSTRKYVLYDDDLKVKKN